ncbi:MAG: hypothetical protein CMF48_02555 [Legionellales bacterium]|nr:hypothetical protein [Legionellales bacterium]|tara:strand:+ start:379 stop:744 length:366 start_codon:yes stop_codon:yes gene_type:complete
MYFERKMLPITIENDRNLDLSKTADNVFFAVTELAQKFVQGMNRQGNRGYLQRIFEGILGYSMIFTLTAEGKDKDAGAPAERKLIKAHLSRAVAYTPGQRTQFEEQLASAFRAWDSAAPTY